MPAKDSNGKELTEGDAVQVIKDLKVKGSSIIFKRGKLFKSIYLTDDDEEVECPKAKPSSDRKSVV